MLRRLVTLIILFTMVLHSASRLGVLSYLYQQRNQIAYAIGLIAEIPIAMCNSDYHISDDLVVTAHDDDATTIPPAVVSAKEIQLFFVGALEFQPSRTIALIDHKSLIVDRHYPRPALSIFHPPS